MFRGSDPKPAQDVFNEENKMMFSGALQAHYYSSKGRDTLKSALGETIQGKKVDAESDADDEEEPDVFDWKPPKKGEKRALPKGDQAATPMRTKADDDYERENNFNDIDELVKTAQSELQSISLSNTERIELQSAASSEASGYKQSGLASKAKSSGSLSANSTVVSVSAAPATPTSAAHTKNLGTPLTPIVEKSSLPAPGSMMAGTPMSILNQVKESVKIIALGISSLKRPFFFPLARADIPSFATPKSQTRASELSELSTMDQTRASNRASDNSLNQTRATDISAASTIPRGGTQPRKGKDEND